MAPTYKNKIFEEREELVSPPLSAPTSAPTLKIAHFLKPSFITKPFSNLLPSLNVPCATCTGPLPLKVTFNGSKTIRKGWKNWVNTMQILHKSNWCNAGIDEAVINSTFTINPNEDLLLGVTERWCSETNTFRFLFGEATITLQDMIILGGYSVFGDCVLDTALPEEEIIINKLEQVRLLLVRSRARKASHFNWMDMFMGTGTDLEHPAFLTLWLSRFVFPSSVDSIKNNVFHIAVRLSRGAKVSLAPAVLANIYRDLSVLKYAVSYCTRCEDETSVTLWANFHLVQAWVWERFPAIRPNPNSVKNSEPRLARWHNLKRIMSIDTVRVAIDQTSSNHFLWDPYCMNLNSSLYRKFYTDEDLWLWVDDNYEEFHVIARCLRASELVGFDCIEQYLPHRTAMQFGFDQDIPGHVERANITPEIAWTVYRRPIAVKKLYWPSRYVKAGVTTQYLDWWINGRKRENDVLVPPPPPPPGLLPKSCMMETNDSFRDWRY